MVAEGMGGGEFMEWGGAWPAFGVALEPPPRARRQRGTLPAQAKLLHGAPPPPLRLQWQRGPVGPVGCSHMHVGCSTGAHREAGLINHQTRLLARGSAAQCDTM